MRLFCWISLASRQKNLHRSARCILYINVHQLLQTLMSVCKEQQDVITIVGTLKEVLSAHVMMDISYIIMI